MTERQEVAEKLRELRHRTYYREEIVESICDAISIADPVNTFREPEDVYELLANLIDPTCELDLDFCMEYIVCQSCGYELPHGTHLDETKYCPNCGSRVVVSKDE
jgi:predicted Zn-ribbon and HTH transcriptional regulator